MSLRKQSPLTVEQDKSLTDCDLAEGMTTRNHHYCAPRSAEVIRSAVMKWNRRQGTVEHMKDHDARFSLIVPLNRIQAVSKDRRLGR